MADNSNTERLLGRILAQIENIERNQRDIKERQIKTADDHERRLGLLELRYAEASGGMRMLILLCGAAATVGGFVATGISRLWGH